MARQKYDKNRYKVPKFKDNYDEDLDWQDRVEIRHLGRKLNRKPQKRKDGFEKW